MTQAPETPGPTRFPETHGSQKVDGTVVQGPRRTVEQLPDFEEREAALRAAREAGRVR